MNDEPRTPAPRGLARVTCWCERSTVIVPTADVRRGLTRSCDLGACYAIYRRRIDADIERLRSTVPA